jgi:hypothetical protein
MGSRVARHHDWPQLGLRLIYHAWIRNQKMVSALARPYEIACKLVLESVCRANVWCKRICKIGFQSRPTASRAEAPTGADISPHLSGVLRVAVGLRNCHSGSAPRLASARVVVSLLSMPGSGTRIRTCSALRNCLQASLTIGQPGLFLVQANLQDRLEWTEGPKSTDKSETNLNCDLP